MNSIQESQERFKIKADMVLKKVVSYIAREIKVTKFSWTKLKIKFFFFFFNIQSDLKKLPAVIL